MREEFIYETAPFPQCHASTIAETPDGTLIAAWFGGTREKHPDVGIWVSRKVDGAWTEPVEVADGVQSAELRHPTWNPVLFQPADGPLLLFFKVGPSPSQWWGEMLSSTDNGRTWGNRKQLPNGGIGPVKNKPVQLDDGTIVCPSSTEHDGWTIHLEFSPDNGKTWTRTDPIHPRKGVEVIQPTILLHGERTLQMLCRDRNPEGVIWQTWSRDGGKAWSEFESTGLPNPNAGLDGVTLADGRHLLVYNHTRRSGAFPAGRQMLNLAVSDDGRTWNAALTLERSEGEYSYPAIIQASDGNVHVTYTWQRRRVRHVVLDPSKIEGVPMADGAWPLTTVDQ